jgi:hypothetical protein
MDPHSLADEPVQFEPVWGANSLLTGKITGNFAFFGLIWGVQHWNLVEFSVPYVEISCESKQGNLFCRTGNSSRGSRESRRPTGCISNVYEAPGAIRWQTNNRL